MLNKRSASAIQSRDDTHPWGVIRPRRAQTDLDTLTIHDGNFVTDNRTQTEVYHDNSQTINEFSSKTVFNAPVQGYVRSAKNAGAVNGFVQITQQVGGLGDANLRSPNHGLSQNPVSSRINRAQTIPQTHKDNRDVRDTVSVAGCDSSSTAPIAFDHELEQELHNLSPDMQAFVKSLQEYSAQRRGEVNTEPLKAGQGRNHTL